MDVFILIVAILTDAQYNMGGSVSFQEFANKRRCEIAASEVRRMLDGKNQVRVEAICVMKGTP